MQHSIKFRAISIVTNEWVYGYFFSDETGAYILKSREELYQVIPKSVSQFSGMHDKQGNEIYEGDTVMYHKPGNIWQCVYIHNRFLLRRFNDNCETYDKKVVNNVKIIGNIHKVK